MVKKNLLTRKIKKVCAKSEIWIPKKSYQLNPLRIDKGVLHQLINDFLFENDESSLVEIEEFEAKYDGRKLFITIVGKFERYDFKTKDFELSRQIRKFEIELE